MNLFQMTKPSQRRFLLMFVIAIVAGILSAFVKDGWESTFPPRGVHDVPPPVLFLEVFGVDVSTKTYTILGVTGNWAATLTHLVFSIVMAEIYCLLAEVLPKVRLLKGAVYGYIAALSAHYVVLPMLGLPREFSIPGFLSELGGTFLWIWTIEVFRAYMREGATGYKNAEDMPS
ncbi:hypothetical protein CJP74_03945 [Psittacicella melopsittaci]|uniref:DUF1440 domain-containing protein n=1 Tax=Psittacicella melopsittaci TaxID=2028576 RepID=A0A3A1Y931_9GAMM|nr:DUF1440 domain-containing protein [Psittacicella melopsittaci]RIY32644.1 hypothetical protein CJP74_03945 [Psittacicella melopsittaci]